MKKIMEPKHITVGKASILTPILELLYSYKYFDEPNYDKIVFMYEKILLEMDVVPSVNNMDWINRENKIQKVRSMSNESI